MYFVSAAQRSAGKDALGDYLVSRYGILQIVFSDVLAEIGSELGIVYPGDLADSKRKMTQSLVGELLRNDQRYGNHYHTLRAIEKAKGRNALLNGTRDMEEIDIMRRELGDLTIVGVFADEQIRYERTLASGRVRDWEEWKELQARVTERQIEQILEMSDIRLYNNGTLEEFYAQIDRVFAPLII